MNTLVKFAISILIGEITISTLNIMVLKEANFLINRLKIIFPIILISLFFIPTYVFFGDDVYIFLISFLIYFTIILIYTKNTIKP